MQPCRRRYTWGGWRGSFFSLNDLCALDVLSQLKRMGVHSLKIEGRLRPAHYVTSVVHAYRRVLDAPTEDEEALAEARNLVGKALGRPLTAAYFLNPHPVEAASPNQSANTGRYLGRVVRCERNRLLTRTRGQVTKGDRLRLVDKARDRQVSFTCQGAEPVGREGELWVLGAPPSEKGQRDQEREHRRRGNCKSHSPEGIRARAFSPGSLLFTVDVANSPSRASESGSRSGDQRGLRSTVGTDRRE